MSVEKAFSVRVSIPGEANDTHLTVIPDQGTFTTSYQGAEISVINNGDNSWSLVTGDISQETVNAIGEAIVNFKRNEKL